MKKSGKFHNIKNEPLQLVITITLVLVTIVNFKIAFNSASEIWSNITDFSMVLVAFGALVTAIYASHLQMTA